MNLARLFLLFLLIVMAGASAYGLSTANDDEESRELAALLKDVPDAVKATILTEILHEVKDLQLEELTREQEEEQIVYEVELELGGKDLELEIAADGKLLDKKVEHDDDDDDDDDEKEDEDDEDEEEDEDDEEE